MGDELNHQRLSENDRQHLISQIRSMVSDNALTYTWLIQRLYDAGLLTDKFELSATLAGTRRGQKANDILCQAYAALCEYESQMSRTGT